MNEHAPEDIETMRDRLHARLLRIRSLPSIARHDAAQDALTVISGGIQKADTKDELAEYDEELRLIEEEPQGDGHD